MIKIGTMLGDRYEILDRIGTGGMSDVYRAKDHKLNRNVAVKVLKQEFSENENFVSKFKTEAQAAAGMMHPNIVNVYDVGAENGIYYIVMELVEGITLKEYIEKKARLSVKEAISIAIQVSMGIESAHNHHIIHRDIKPQNIMISKDGKVKVTDFGIAKAVTSNTITSNVMGSVHYTSPEQARGGYSDEKSDIYSLGITMFEMLTGRVPFNGETTVAIAIKHIQEPMPSPREYIPEIPVSVEQIVFKCTQKNPDRRYQSMAELIADLKESLIHPNEDFVKMNNTDEEAVTKLISEDDMQQIKKQTRKRNDADAHSAKKSNEGRKVKPAPQKKRPKNAGEKSSGASERRKYNEQEDNDEDDAKMDRVTTILAIIAAVLFAVVVILIVGKTMGFFSGREETTEEESTTVTETVKEPEKEEITTEQQGVRVPDVVGLSYAEAVATLKKEGFETVKEEQESDTVKKNNIIATVPKAGDRLERGSIVTLYVSVSAEAGKIAMPNLIGLTEEDAVVVLVESGFEVGEITETTHTDPALTGQVCYQSYLEGTMVAPGTSVDIKISIGSGESTYYFMGNIESPVAEDDAYVEGSPATVILTTSQGAEIKRETTATFPVSFNISGIAGAQDGVISIVYNVTIPGQIITNEDGTQTQAPDTQEERVIHRPVKFAKE